MDCCIYQCSKPVKALGMCVMHYTRQSRYGDPHKTHCIRRGNLHTLSRIRIGDTVHVELTDGLFAKIDHEDMERISGIVWRSVLRHKTRYAVGTVRGGKTVYMHRLLFGKDGLDTDHINGDGLDNRSSNIRCVPHHINLHNNRKRQAGTDARGVAWYDPMGKWQSKMMWKGKSIHIGYFHRKEDAEEARTQKEKELGVYIGN